MSGPKNGGPAFPVHGGTGLEWDDPRNRILGGGMTLRDYFAGQALGQLVSKDGWTDYEAFFIAQTSYELADAMIKAREL
jgi:hypothetical protein